MNDTGMAYFDGNRWYHIWFSANEGLVTGRYMNLLMLPYIWKFKGSKILKSESKKLILSSNHEVKVDGAILHIERIAFFKAGEPYFILLIKFSNVSDKNIDFIYVYGDEPWVRDYGSSAGDVGWADSGLIFHEGSIDVQKNNFIGFYDYGNDVINEGHNFTNLANFIEWLDKESVPDLAYFSNNVGNYSQKSVPLYSNNNRLLSIEWGPKNLKPGEKFTLKLAIGMAFPSLNAKPMKPNVNFNNWNFYIN